MDQILPENLPKESALLTPRFPTLASGTGSTFLCSLPLARSLTHTHPMRRQEGGASVRAESGMALDPRQSGWRKGSTPPGQFPGQKLMQHRAGDPSSCLLGTQGLLALLGQRGDLLPPWGAHRACWLFCEVLLAAPPTPQLVPFQKCFPDPFCVATLRREWP